MNRFAFITTNLTIGGAQTWLVNASRLLLKCGHEVHVILFESILDLDLPEGTKVHFLLPRRKFFGTRFSKWLAARRLSRLVDRIGPLDLIVSTLPFADQITSSSKVQPVFYRIANTLSQEVTSLEGAKSQRRHRRYAKLYSRKSIISVSNGVKNDLVDHFGLHSEDIITIYNPVDKEKLVALSEIDSELSIEEPFLIHSGRFSIQKRHDVLLDAFRVYLERAQLGDPKKLILLTEESEKLNKMIDERGLDGSVVNVGFQQNPYPWYRQASCLVLSSDREGMPNVLLEALALGTPVASTNCPSGPSELLASFYPKCLCPMGSPTALADAIFKSFEMDMAIVESILEPFRPSKVLEQLITLCNRES